MSRLLEERAVALGSALENTSAATYSSHLNSYLAFCNLHNFPINPTADTLSFYVVFMGAHIKPGSIKSYLSGICSCLEPYYPDVRTIRNGLLVSRTLAGVVKMNGSSITRKRPLMETDLQSLLNIYSTSSDHDDTLFLSIIFTAWHCLMRLGELVDHDNPSLRSARKSVK